MPFTESELALWEDHWIITAQKLQQVSLPSRDRSLSPSSKLTVMLFSFYSGMSCPSTRNLHLPFH